MDKHLEEEHGLTDVNNDTVNTTIFNEGLDREPSKHSTQTPKTTAEKDLKRRRSGSVDEEEEPEPKKLQEEIPEDGEQARFLNTQEGEGDTLLSSTADRVEMDLINQVREKAERQRREMEE